MAVRQERIIVALRNPSAAGAWSSLCVGEYRRQLTVRQAKLQRPIRQQSDDGWQIASRHAR